MNHLLNFPSDAVIDSIDSILRAIKEAVPIPGKHKKELPFAIRDLSRMLTEERSSISRPYWSAPRFLSAYTYYFMPWNLYRLAFILPNLSLPLLPGSKILDLGSGPLTLPIALWCARPELRSIPLHFTCGDLAVKPMEAGLAALKQADPELPWSFDLARGSIESLLAPGQKHYDLIMGGNVLNELSADKGTTLESKIDKIMRSMAARTAPEGTLFLIEPGTRLGGKMLYLARKGALQNSLSVLAPCTHQNPCPANDQTAYFDAAPPFNSWCHFTCPVFNAPAQLLRLTEQAGFKRKSLAMSFLLLHKGQNCSAPRTDDSLDLDELEALYAESMRDDDDMDFDEAPEFTPAPTMQQLTEIKPPVTGRIISGDIALQEGTARYVCCAAGLTLAMGAERIPSGGSILLDWEVPPVRDRKTGAILAKRAHRERTPDHKETAAKARRGKSQEKPYSQRQTKEEYAKARPRKKEPVRPDGRTTPERTTAKSKPNRSDKNSSGTRRLEKSELEQNRQGKEGPRGKAPLSKSPPSGKKVHPAKHNKPQSKDKR